MLLNEMILYHELLIALLSIGVIIGLLIPNIDDIKKVKHRFRVYTFTLHTLIATTGFSGLVLFIFAKKSIDPNILIMIISYIVLTILEIKKYFSILNSNNLKDIRVINLKYTTIYIFIILVNFWRY